MFKKFTECGPRGTGSRLGVIQKFKSAPPFGVGSRTNSTVKKRASVVAIGPAIQVEWRSLLIAFSVLNYITNADKPAAARAWNRAMVMRRPFRSNWSLNRDEEHLMRGKKATLKASALRARDRFHSARDFNDSDVTPATVPVPVAFRYFAYRY